MNKPERCKAVIDLNQLKQNYNLIQNHIGKDVLLSSVVKANAYGHGSKEVSLYLESIGCTFFSVACLEEAIELREAGLQSDILIFGKTDPENALILNAYSLIQTVSTYAYASSLNKVGKPIRIHIKIDTGMSRFGMYCHEEEDFKKAIDEIKQISQLPHLSLHGIYTHFAEAEKEDSTFTKKQFNQFMKLLDLLKKEKIEVGIRHCANSSATLQYPFMHLDMVRIGIALYGYPPVKTTLNLEPVMELLAEVVQLKNIKPHDTVSYGRKFTSLENKTIATLAIGYADGYLRGLSNKDYFLFEGKTLLQIGTICMDACMCDVTDATKIKVKDYVIVFGKEKPASVLAKTLQTIDYEILTSISQRVKRIYQ
ncbi:MAG: alanine racemase [Firmicutes bacterium]|nr:alanine racemase [Bacillota bacterium]